MRFYLLPLRRRAAEDKSGVKSAALQGAAQLFGVRWLGSALVGGDVVAATWPRRNQMFIDRFQDERHTYENPTL